MFITIIVAVIATVGIIGTLRALTIDGYRATPTDPSRLP